MIRRLLIALALAALQATRARQVRVWLYSNRWAAFRSDEYKTAGLPCQVGAETPTRCGGLSWPARSSWPSR